MKSIVPKVYFDWNLWSNITRLNLETDTIIQNIKKKKLEILISPAIIEEMCQSPPEVISANLKTMRNVIKTPLLRHLHKIEVNELLAQIAESCKGIKVNNSNLNCSIFGDGNAPADRDWHELQSSDNFDISNEVVMRLQKNKLVNAYFQIQLKNFEQAFDLEEEKLSIKEAQQKIDYYLKLKIQTENISIEQLKEKIKNEKGKSSFIKKAVWHEKTDIEKERIIRKFCISQVFHEYIMPFGFPQINRLKKATKFLGALNIQSEVEAEKLLDCVTKEINYKHIPTLWIGIFVSLLQETQSIKRSNIFDQEHACYTKEIDYFFTCDKDLYRILSDNLLTQYLKSIGSKYIIIYLNCSDISVESILSKMEIV